jgi:deoxyribonuclease-4
MGTSLRGKGGLLLGAHESVAGGLYKAFERAATDGAQSIQIFTKNARGWASKPLEPADIAEFRRAAKASGAPSAAHASYLINLAAEDPELRRKSLDAMADEVARCDLLGVPSLVVHPGSHPDEKRGIALVAEGLREVHKRNPRSSTRILLENTAGQGNSLGHRVEQLAAMHRAVGKPGWFGFCLDTCHLFAAGYDLSTAAGYRSTMAQLDDLIGLSLVRAFHLNDCKGPLGCRVDRHEDIGKGQMGLQGFECLINDRRFRGVPAMLETEEGHQQLNLAALRALAH